MKNNEISASAFHDTKPHYHILDGLRGVAALTVVCFHLFEAFATSHIDQIVNHGYLAVDFFFMLSGFVIGYAYDNRIESMSIGNFIKRRLIRLHPMVIMGAFIGALLFYTQECNVWDVSKVSIGLLMISTLLNMLLFPVWGKLEVRGLGEMYPLNGPTWSLFFEYIGNILYIFFIRKLPTSVLTLLVFLSGCGLAIFSIFGPLGDICVGFALDNDNIIGGMLRLLFAFSAGLLLSRIFRERNVKGAFWICSIGIVTISAIPRIGGNERLWMNGIYDAACVLFLFPAIIILGASGKTTDKVSTQVCKFLGDISYPLYMVHYPFIYLYYAWVKNNQLTFIESLPGAIALIIGTIALAYICLKYYDTPLRKYLSQRWLKR